MPQNTSVIALIGMSNIGKSHWAKRLAKAGYKRYTIDDMIADKLADLHVHDVSDLARWLGQPWSPGHAEREQIYLDLENESVLEALEIVEKSEPGDKIVIDTTGSMFYTPESTAKKLKQTAKIVYLIAPDHIRRDMLQKYIDEPKPVIWGSMFEQKALETRGQALARCYEELLTYRTKLYEQYAEVTIGYDERFKPGYSTDDFLRQVEA